jgi:hypothetical protein
MPGGIAARCSEVQVFIIFGTITKICVIMPPTRQFGGKYMNLLGVKLVERGSQNHF